MLLVHASSLLGEISCPGPVGRTCKIITIVGFTARPPPAKAPQTLGPKLPTADERLSGLEEEDISLSALAALFRPSPSDLDWISSHISGASTEGPRVHTKRFWQCRPQFHQNL